MFKKKKNALGQRKLQVLPEYELLLENCYANEQILILDTHPKETLAQYLRRPVQECLLHCCL